MMKFSGGLLTPNDVGASASSVNSKASAKSRASAKSHASAKSRASSKNSPGPRPLFSPKPQVESTQKWDVESVGSNNSIFKDEEEEKEWPQLKTTAHQFGKSNEDVQPGVSEDELSEGGNTVHRENDNWSQAEESVADLDEEVEIPPSSSFVLLDESKCRVLCKVKTNQRGPPQEATCGHAAKKCSVTHHKAKQKNRNLRYPAGHYVRVTDTRGHHHGNSVLPCLSAEEFKNYLAYEQTQAHEAGEQFAGTAGKDDDSFAEDHDLDNEQSKEGRLQPDDDESLSSEEGEAGLRFESSGEEEVVVVQEPTLPSETAPQPTRTSSQKKSSTPYNNQRRVTRQTTTPRKVNYSVGTGSEDDSDEPGPFLSAMVNPKNHRHPRVASSQGEEKQAKKEGYRREHLCHSQDEAQAWLFNALTEYMDRKGKAEREAERTRNEKLRRKEAAAREASEAKLAAMIQHLQESLTGQPASTQPGPTTLEDDTPEGTYGLERLTPFQRILIGAHEQDELAEKEAEGFEIKALFEDYSAARKWLTSRPSRKQSNASRMTSNSRPQGPPLPDSGRKSSRAFMFGTDPSAGDKTRIYQTETLDSGSLNQALCPENFPPGKENVVALFDHVMDVTSLPGNKATWTAYDPDDANTRMQETLEMAAMAQQQASSQGSSKRDNWFKSRRYNSLLQIRSEEDLFQTTNRVQSYAEKDLDLQNHRITDHLYNLGYDQDTIQLYLEVGGLPRLIVRTLELYKRLLERCVKAVRDHPDDNWSKSHAQTMR
mmetsp:Transcript_19708/g.42457  ORF Transcript_19708/g.42457 Transcript_19708/m.42457 type:complete len:767 (+) Transcript_19708:3036-5336(+)